MNKPQALNAFWESFGLDAYDSTIVLPENTPYPRISYDSATGAIGDILNLSASLWYRSSGWAEIETKTAEIGDALPEGSSYIIKIDGGYMRIMRGRPFAQRVGDPDDPGIRRMIINIQVEFLTAT